MLSSDDVFFGVSTPEGYKPADEAAIASILATLHMVLPSSFDPSILKLESLEGALALETFASQIRIKIAKGE